MSCDVKDMAIELKPKVSIIIPVKNASGIIGSVLEAVLGQVVPWSFEVIVIDSGSNDGTLDIIKSYTFVQLVQIPPEEYGHGRTRNLGVKLSKGKYVAFLTHDAIPANNKWLLNLVSPLEDDSRIAGVFGRHIAHDNASFRISRELDQHFENFHQAGKVFWIQDAERYQNDLSYRQNLHYYSDNNSCLRRSIWEHVPYPDVDFAEDQLWAKSIIERGYRKAYAHDAVVKHSHDFGVVETFKRSFDESKAFRIHFGYILGGANLWEAFCSGLTAALGDYRYTRSECPKSTVAIACVAAGCQFAKHLGHWLGRHSDKLPHWVQREVSLDMKLKYGKFRIGEGIIKFIRIMRLEGSRPALARTFGLLSKKINSSVVVMESKKDVAGFFRAVYSPEHCNQANPILRVSLDFSADVDILWFIPDFGAGSGGHLNIIRFVSGLERFGMRSAIVIVGGHSHANHGEAKAKLDKYFGETSSLIYFEEDLLPKVNKIIATSWITAHFAKHYSSSELDRYYFVQDYEPLFYPAGFDAIAAAVTYSLGFQSICAGSWIVEELKQRHGVKALGYFGFSYDKEIYKRVPKRDNVERVFFYVRPPTARRGFELGLLALDLVGRLRPGVNFIFAGWDVSDYRFDHIHLNAGVLHTSELPDLYSQCDVALILSFSNMSLLPYEVMACGCAVVTNNDACATWGLNKEVAEFAAATPEALAQAIIRLLEDKDARAKRVEIARKFVEETCWDREIGKVGRLLVGAGE